MKALFNRCLTRGRGCVVCAVIIAASGFLHGRAEAADGRGSRFCIIVPPARTKPAVEPIRYLPGEFQAREIERESGVKSFFKGQIKKVGFGVPDCFQINPEGTAVVTANPAFSPVGRLDQGSKADKDRIFPGVGYFNRTSTNGRSGVAFGVGLGESAPDFGEERGDPDARVGIVFGFNF